MCCQRVRNQFRNQKNSIMKKLSFLVSVLSALFFALLFTACQDDSGAMESSTLSETASVSVTSEAAVASSMEDVDLLADAGMELFATSGRGLRDHLLECAEIAHDTASHVITIDFGDGCEDRFGTWRSGKIVIEYNERKYVPGAYRIVTFEDFFLDSVQVEGTRTITNVTDTSGTGIAFETSLVGGKLTFPDGSTITREAEHLRTLYVGEEREDNYASLSGSASGTLQNGNTYSSTIMEDLIFKRGCKATGVHIPVAGVLEIVAGDNTVVIDYGDGECDNLAEVTTNGETETIEVEPRGRRRPHKRG